MTAHYCNLTEHLSRLQKVLVDGGYIGEQVANEIKEISGAEVVDQSRAQTARATADGFKYCDVAYLDRRIKECKKEIKAREKNIISYEQALFTIENG